MELVDKTNKKDIIGLFKRINGVMIYNDFTTEEIAFNELQKAGYRVISKRKDYSNENQTIFICYR